MALDRLVPVSTTPGAVTGNNYMDAVQEEITGLWDRASILLSGVSGTNTITATVTPALTAGLVDGMQAILRPAATNTGATTLNGVAVKDAEGTALTAGALRSGGTYDLVYVSALTSWIMIGYFPALVSGTGMKLVKTQTASASATIDFVNGVASVVMDDTYDAYQVVISSMRPATDNVDFKMRVGTGAGPTYQATSYRWCLVGYDEAGTGGFDGSASDTSIPITESQGNAATRNANILVEFNDPEVAQRMPIRAQSSYVDNAGANVGKTVTGQWDSATAITAIRFLFSSGNIAAGRFTLYGKTKV